MSLVAGNKDLRAAIGQVTKCLLSLDPRTRNYGIKYFEQLLLKYSGDKNDAFDLKDYLLAWIGIIYYLWVSDKPIRQENALKKISNLIHSCTSYQGKILFLNAFFLTIKDGEYMTPHADRFIIMLRRCLRQLIFTFINYDWNLEYLNKCCEVLHKALKLSSPVVRTHLQDIFLEELVEVSRGHIPSEALVIIIDSF